MSDKPEGPDWWIASDGKWYPPELHPSARGDSPAVTPDRRATAPAEDGGAGSKRWQGQADRRVGPRVPDLFQKAMEGSHLADTVSVKYDGDDERNGHPTLPSSPRSTPVAKRGGGTPVAAGVAGATIGAPPTTAKRRWRKSR